MTLEVDDPDGEPSEAQRDVLLSGWSDHVHTTDALLRVTEADRGVRAAEAARLLAVQEARSAGRTWDEIGRALGVTRQTAWERFRLVGEDAQG